MRYRSNPNSGRAAAVGSIDRCADATTCDGAAGTTSRPLATPGAGRDSGAGRESDAGSVCPDARRKPGAGDLRLATDLGAAAGVSATIAGVAAPVAGVAAPVAGVTAPVAVGTGRKGDEPDGLPTSACATSIAGTATTIPTPAPRA